MAKRSRSKLGQYAEPEFYSPQQPYYAPPAPYQPPRRGDVYVPASDSVPLPGDILDRVPLSIKIALGITSISTLVMYLSARRDSTKAIKEAAVVAGPVVSDSASLATVKSAMPAYAHYIADIAFELGPKYGIDPVLIIATSYHESGWGSFLWPTKGPTGYGDRVGRKDSPKLRAIASRLGVTLTRDRRGIVPDKKGWGWGLFQIDMASHEKFLASGKWSDPRESMKYAIENVWLSNKKDIKRAFPNISEADLWYATVVSFNSGAGGAIRGLKRKNGNAKLIDQQPGKVTFHPGYAADIFATAAKLRAGKKVGR
jgi:hypothetical protein